MEQASLNRAFLDTVPGEIAFFRGIMQARPIGINRHFHMLTVQQHIKEATKRTVSLDVLWDKLEDMYDLDKLENMDVSEPDESPPLMDIPLPDSADWTNLSSATVRSVIFHPHFRAEFSLPHEEFEPIMAQRRVKETPSSADESTARPSRRNFRSKDRNAGLVSGDSESSELTEGDGDQEASRVEDSAEDHSHVGRRGKQSSKVRKSTQSTTKTRGVSKNEILKRKKRG